MDTFSQTYNTQRENENTILTSEKIDKSDALVETLKWLAINEAGYYESDLVNSNDAKFDPASDPKISTCTSDGKKIKVTDTSNGYLQQKVLSNWTLLIINTMMDPRVDGGFATWGASLHNPAMPLKA